MRKQLLIILATLCCAISALAQEVVPKMDYDSRLYGIYNNRSQRWVVQPMFKTIWYMGPWDGVYYFCVETENSKFGIIRSKDYSHFYINPDYDEIKYCNFDYSNFTPLLAVRKGSDWGLYDIFLQQLFPIKYQTIVPYATWVLVREWNGKDYNLSHQDIRQIQQQRAEQQKREEEIKRQEAEAQQRAEAERKAREKKEAELASFTAYAQSYVQPKIAAWQEKGEYEKTDAYRKRVTGSNRQVKIDSLTTAAEHQFISEHAALNPLQQLKISGNYDADNEVYRLECPKFGTMLVRVPIEDAPSFKNNFASLEKRNAKYFIENDKIALRSVDFFNPQTQNTYSYNNSAALNYTTYSIDADALGLQAFTISSTDNRTVVAADKPKVHILDPTTNSRYSSAEITIRCNIETNDGSTPTLYVEINGGEANELHPKAPGQSKGAKPMSGKEYAINLPTDNDRPCNLTFYAMGANNVPSETKKLTLQYVGEKPKPVLHIYAVGVGDYASSDLEDLKYAAKDAQQFEQAIRKVAGNTYRDIKSQVIVNKSATKQNVETSLSRLTNEVQQGDVVMLFFSGHGVRDGEDTYFMTTDGVAADPAPNSVDFSYIKKRLNRLIDKQCKVILFMDACHSGAMQSKSGLRDLRMMLPNLIGFYSSSKLEESAESDKLGNGAFTHALLEGIGGKAANSDGQITTFTLRNYIENELRKSNAKQTPQIENEVGEIVLFDLK